MAWGDIAEPETDPFAPLKSSLFKRLNNNPVAIAEGAPNAPRIRRQAGIVQTVTASNGFSVPISVGSGNGHSGFSGRLVLKLKRTLVANPFVVAFSKNGGSTYPDSVTMINVGSGGGFLFYDFSVWVNTLTGAVWFAGHRSTIDPTAPTDMDVSSFAGTVPNSDASVTHVRFSYGESGDNTSQIAALIERNGGGY